MAEEWQKERLLLLQTIKKYKLQLEQVKKADQQDAHIIITQLSDRVQALESENERLKSGSSISMDEIVQDLKVQVLNKNNEVKKLQSACFNAETQIQKLKEEMATQGAQKQHLEITVEASNQLTNSLKQSIISLESQIDELKASLQKQKELNAKHEETIAIKDIERKGMEVKVEELKSKYENLENEFSKYKARAHSILNQNGVPSSLPSMKKIYELEQQLAQNEKEKMGLKQDFNDLLEKKNEISARLDELLSFDYESQIAQYYILKVDHQQAMQEIDKLRQDLETRDMERMNNRVLLSTTEIESRTMMDQLNQKIYSLEVQLKQRQVTMEEKSIQSQRSLSSDSFKTPGEILKADSETVVDYESQLRNYALMLKESGDEVIRLGTQERALKEEIKRLDQILNKREQVNIEYLRNVVFQFIKHPEERVVLAPVIKTLLKLTDEEVNQITQPGLFGMLGL